MIKALTKELEDIKLKYQVNEINIKKYDTSSKLVKDICDIQIEYKEKKGAGLGYTKTPPPYNHNYTYLPFTEEELINEGKMTYGPKTDKSSVNNKFVGNKQPAPSINFVSKGNVDPNRSFTCVEEKVDLRCEDTLGGEQVLNSDLPKNCFDETDSEFVLGQSIFRMFASLVSNGPDVLVKTDYVCVEYVRSLRIHSVKPLKLLLKKIKNILILPLSQSQWVSLMLNLVGPHWKPLIHVLQKHVLMKFQILLKLKLSQNRQRNGC
ncbi:hypothetical protein Hanom_Chr14g01248721 [Helianthus anomalus]